MKTPHYRERITCKTGEMIIDRRDFQPAIYNDAFWEWSQPIDATNQIPFGGAKGLSFASGDTYEQSFLKRPGSYS